MTLGVIKSAIADRDNVFSNALRTHAKALELSARSPVGPWTFGQGIRCAQNESYFYNLTSKNFLPLGINHPVTLVTTLAEEFFAPQKFTNDLLKVFPLLEGWHWTLLAPDHEWFSEHPTCFAQSDPTLTSPLGWSGFEILSTISDWTVRLSDDVIWVASLSPLPVNGLFAPAERAWLKVFLTADALGPEGRLQELRSVVSHAFPDFEVNGLSVTCPGTEAQFAQQGILCDQRDPKSVQLHFPLSFLKIDLEEIAMIVHGRG